MPSLDPADRVLRLDEVVTSKRAVHGIYSCGDLRFSTATWYDSVDFDGLRQAFGDEAIDRIAFHVAAFEINKIASLRPTFIDWGHQVRFADTRFTALWTSVYRNVWAQWRYENDDWDYPGPEPVTVAPTEAVSLIAPRNTGGPDILAFCGGGKDSLLAMDLLCRTSRRFDSLTYAASTYGALDAQHELIAGLLDHARPEERRRQWVTDDFMALPVVTLRPDLGIATVTAAETPSSIFSALPYVLQHGYSQLCLAHEASADAPQAWSPAGDPINHQWGKSYEAEKLINDYVGDRLVEGFRYFSILKPIHDLNIFGALRGLQPAVPATHSCNVTKPWCMRCPKCLYVWLGYAAFLPETVVEKTFGAVRPLEDSRNIATFRELTGLADRLPFECVGEADEATILMRLCVARGYGGPVVDACAMATARIDPARVMDTYLAVNTAGANLPTDLQAALAPILRSLAAETREFIKGSLEGT